MPSQYASITKEARKRPFPYTVIKPDHTLFKADFSPLPRRPKNISLPLSSIPLLYSPKLPIQETKYEHLQQLKSDCHSFYDNLPYKKK